MTVKKNILLLFVLVFIPSWNAAVVLKIKSVHGDSFNLSSFEKERVLTAADKYLAEVPVTITSSTSPRSGGGKHDFFPKEIIGGRILQISLVLMFKEME